MMVMLESTFLIRRVLSHKRRASGVLPVLLVLLVLLLEGNVTTLLPGVLF